MQKCKYFEIKQVVLNNGSTIYKVFGWEKKPMKLFRWIVFPVEYSKDNKSFEEALEQIEYLSFLIPKEIRTVYSTHYVFSDKKQFENIKQ